LTSTTHFRAIMARKMMQIIVDHYRRRRAQKRGGGAHRVSMESVNIQWCDREVDLLDLSDALAELESESRRFHDIVMLHWFANMPYPEVAGELGLSASTVEKDFRYSMAWLSRRLESKVHNGDRTPRASS